MIATSLLLYALVQASPAPAVRETPPRTRSGYISNADYPREALRARAQGQVRTSLSIDARGAVTDCRITVSSGSQALDARTCDIITTRFGFYPATRNGRPVAGTLPYSIAWRLPR